jgi:signal transduction histidine kinase
MSISRERNPFNIRKLLVVWHTIILAGLLLIFTIGLYAALNYHLYTEVDSSLVAWAAHTIESFDSSSPLVEGRVQIDSNRLFSRLSLLDSFALVFNSAHDLLNDRTILSNQSLVKLRSLLTTWTSNSRDSYATIDLETQAFRIYLKNIPDRAGQTKNILIIGRALMHVQNTLRELVVTLILAWMIAVFICVVISWIFVGWTLHPVKRMTNDALKIAASGKLDRRIVESGKNDEFGELSKALNSMLTSLEVSYITLRRFLGDVSHELRTPLTSIRSNLEFIQRATRAPENERFAALHDTMIETERMAGLINNLLLLARSEAPASFVFEKIDFAEIVSDVTASYHTRLVQLKRKIITEITGPSMVNGDREKLRQAFVILLDNAIKYAPVRSKITILLKRIGKTVRLKISDAGPGIPENELGLVFNRFYRASNVRSKYAGTGLGLPIVKTILDNHNSKIELSNLKPHGLVVTITIPASS